MAYKSAVLGCGPRAGVHISAYEGLEEMVMDAACDRDRTRLDNHGEKFSIPHLYEDLEEMLSKERPDILHIVTPPGIREEPMDLATRYGVKGIIVEKPIALTPSQALKIKEIAQRTGVKIAVNMQRRYFETCQRLRKVLLDGEIGDIQFMRCVTKGNILSMGPHMVDLILFFLNDAAPTQVWASAYGMNGYDYGHPAPANLLIEYTFPGQVVVHCEDSEEAVGTVGETNFWQHLEFDIWGSKGRAWWLQNREWGYQSEGMATPHVEKTSWAGSDVLGQRAFTRALAHWLDDDRNVHMNCLDHALKGFDAIMGGLQSAYVQRRLDLPTDVCHDLIEKLERRLTCGS